VARLRPSWALLALASCLGAGAAIAACSADNEGDSSSTGSTQGSGGTGGESSSGVLSGGNSNAGGFTPAGSGGGSCMSTPEDDFDEDGFTEADGDCNDCDPFVNPNAVEVIAEPDEDGGVPQAADEDCDGDTDELAEPCDSGIALDEMDPLTAAKAIGLCAFVDEARWVLADGSPPPVDPTQLANFHLGHGVLDHLGPNNPTQEGARMLMLSSGTARREEQPGFFHRNFEKGYTSNPPAGFPKESPSCGPSVTTGPPTDATGLEVEITAPSNALGLSFDFNFFTYEWPKFICTTFNDFFVAIMEPFPNNQPDGNISFDSGGNPISVNNAFLDVCGCPGGPPCAVPPSNPVKTFDCAFGTTGVMGTDWDVDDGSPVGWTNGSTGWLRTTAPAEPGKPIKLRFVVYDSQDHKVDSAVLLDNWQWSGTPGTVETVIPPPK